MWIVYIVVAVVGLLLMLLPEIVNRVQGAAVVRERLGKRTDLVMGILGTVGLFAFLIGILGVLITRFAPGFDLSQGIEFSDREALTIGGNVQIRYYGIIIVLAMLVAANVSARLAKVDGRDPEHIWGALTWAIIPGIVFARLWYVTFPPITSNLTAADYYSNFFDVNNGVIAIWSGGLHIFGAVIGGLLGAYIYFRRNGLVVPAWLDIAAIGIPLGQAIGRWANYINQELYGTVTNLPWGITIDSASRVFPFTSTIDFPVATTRFHPLFLYESLWSLLAFIVLLNLFLRQRERFAAGSFFWMFLAQYSVIRFLLEFLRLEISVVAGFNLSQVVMMVVFLLSLGMLLRNRGAQFTPRKALKDRPSAGANA